MEMVASPFLLFIDLFSEGKKTEPDYLEKFAEQHAKNKVKVNCLVRGQSLERLIDAAIEYSKTQLDDRYANRILCIVADKDKLSDSFLTQAIAKTNAYNKKCRKPHQKIRLYISNPCIELWALAHFVDKAFPDTARSCQQKLKAIMPRYDHDRGAPLFDIKSMTEERYQKAKKLALTWMATANNDPNQFPYTDIMELLEDIKRIGQQ